MGRDREIVAGRDAVASASGVLLVGPPGVGKSRLAEEIARRAAAETGADVHAVVASTGVQVVPLGAFTHLLGDESSALDRVGLWRSLARRLTPPDGTRPLLLTVDDVQWLDDLSAGFVHHLATTGQATVVLTARTPGPVPQPILSLWKDGVVERLELEALEAGTVEALLTAVLGGPIEPRTVAKLAERSAGNVLFLRELVEAAVDDGSLKDLAGTWCLRGPLGPSDRLAELIGERFESLDEPVRAAVELLAIGGSLPAAVAEALIDEATLLRAERGGLIAVESGGTGRPTDVRLAHPLYADVLERAMPAITRRRVGAELVTAFEGAGVTDDAHQALRVVLLRAATGVPTAPATLLTAAAQAMAVFDFDVAERLARAAVDAGGGAGAAMAVGEALLAHGKSRDAEAVLAGVDPAELANDEERAQLARAHAAAIVARRNGLDEAASVLESAITTLAPSGERDLLQANLASYLMDGGRVALGAPLALALVTDPAVDVRARVRAVTPAAMWLSLSGRGEEALALCDDLEGDAFAVQDVQHLSAVGLMAQRLLALWVLGEHEAHEQLAEAIEHLALAEHRPALLAASAMVRGRSLAYRGRLRAGLVLLERSIAEYEQTDPHGHLLWAQATACQAYGMLGDAQAAAAARQRFEPASAGATAMFTVEMDAARAWQLAASGARTDGAALLVDAADRAAADGLIVVEVHLLHEALRIGRAEPAVTERLAAIGATVPGRDGRARARHATGLHDRDGDELTAAGEAFDDVGSPLRAAEAYADAARAYRAAGSPAAATRAAERSRTRLELCDGPPRTPRLEAWSDEGGGLTMREREVAVLAARGLNNPEIAQELGLSPRTVETHLHRVYVKLDLHDREALGHVVGA